MTTFLLGIGVRNFYGADNRLLPDILFSIRIVHPRIAAVRNKSYYRQEYNPKGKRKFIRMISQYEEETEPCPLRRKAYLSLRY